MFTGQSKHSQAAWTIWRSQRLYESCQAAGPNCSKAHSALKTIISVPRRANSDSESSFISWVHWSGQYIALIKNGWYTWKSTHKYTKLLLVMSNTLTLSMDQYSIGIGSWNLLTWSFLQAAMVGICVHSSWEQFDAAVLSFALLGGLSAPLISNFRFSSRSASVLTSFSLTAFKTLRKQLNMSILQIFSLDTFDLSKAMHGMPWKPGHNAEQIAPGIAQCACPALASRRHTGHAMKASSMTTFALQSNADDTEVK